MDEQTNIKESAIDKMIRVNASIALGIDEFTLVLQPSKRVDIMLWAGTADEMIQEFMELASIKEYLGEVEFSNNKLVNGYNSGYLLAERPFYLCMCYNGEHESMGVCIKFSATAYANYKMQYEIATVNRMTFYKFLQMVKSDKYTQRLSRVDLTADYFDMPDPIFQGQYLSPHTIYNCLLKKQMVVVDHNDRSNIRTMTAFNKDGFYETVYIGSKKGNTRGFLRIYDKKQEQIDHKASKYLQALSVNSWIRFEAVYKGIYANSIGDMLLDENLIQSENDLDCFIAGKILDKYTFRYPSTNDAVDFSEVLMEIRAGQPYDPLVCASPRDNSLYQSLKYLVLNSGMMITLAKAHFMYPSQQVESQILEWMLHMFETYYLDKIEKDEQHEVYKWLRKHQTTTTQLTIDEILESVELDIESDSFWYGRADKNHS